MDTKPFVIGELALFAWREGERLAPGSDDAKLAIAFIISNRVKAGWQNGDWLKILEAVPLHSASEPGEMLTMKLPDIWSPGWRKLHDKCRDIYDGMLPDTLTWTPSRGEMAANVPGCELNPLNQSRPSFFYANLQLPVRQWFIEKIIQNPDEHPQTINISNLITLFG